MKLQIDTITKVIKVEGRVNLSELFATLEDLLPNCMWEEYSLESTTIINNWNTPIIWRPSVQPYTQPWITWDNSKITCAAHTGVFNINVE